MYYTTEELRFLQQLSELCLIYEKPSFFYGLENVDDNDYFFLLWNIRPDAIALPEQPTFDSFVEMVNCIFARLHNFVECPADPDAPFSEFIQHQVDTQPIGVVELISHIVN